MFRVLLVLIFAIGLAGCMGSGVQEMQARHADHKAQQQERRANLVKRIAEADIPPLPKNWKQQVEAGVRASLRDPDSARFLFVETPSPSELAPGIQKWGREEVDGTTIFGWRIYFGVNAKNAYGGYTGNQPWEAIFVDGRLRDVSAFGR